MNYLRFIQDNRFVVSLNLNRVQNIGCHCVTGIPVDKIRDIEQCVMFPYRINHCDMLLDKETPHFMTSWGALLIAVRF
jgi:hypothetical protein